MLPVQNNIARGMVERLQAEISQMPQYAPKTTEYFHGGMYCREVWRDAGVLVVGKVHRKEHFYMIVRGTVLITTDEGAQEITGPRLLLSKPGTKRAVFAVTEALCMTFHRTDAMNTEDAEAELVEPDSADMYLPGNKMKTEVLT
jgi:hypothetical protein